MNVADNNTIVLYEKKEDCCGCGACLNICPRNAITMKEDKCGYKYPVIDISKCIKCGQCKKVCAFQNRDETNKPIDCYAAVSKNKKQVMRSSSGGIFASLAAYIIDQGGIVYGAAYGENWKVHHVAVESKKQLIDLQGSKYVHSDTENTFSIVKEQLKLGRLVLYSGTPCQIAGLQSFLGTDYDNLLTVDIVCHGVPSYKMFHDYLHLLEEKYGGTITSFSFRDKSKGWGINGSIVINGKKRTIWGSSSSYFHYFLKGWIYRENCYKCKYACSNRPADITLGDYWGIEKHHPELLTKDGWDDTKGISCIVINTDKGKKYLEDLPISLQRSNFAKISDKNTQLLRPCKKGNRDEIIRIYKTGGRKEIDNYFRKSTGIKNIVVL